MSKLDRAALKRDVTARLREEHTLRAYTEEAPNQHVLQQYHSDYAEGCAESESTPQIGSSLVISTPLFRAQQTAQLALCEFVTTNGTRETRPFTMIDNGEQPVRWPHPLTKGTTTELMQPGELFIFTGNTLHRAVPTKRVQQQSTTE